MKLYAQINKVDEENRMVWGYATTGARDSQGEVVAPEAVAAAWDDYMKFANIREMHQPSAVGVVKEYSFEDGGVMIGAKVVDEAAWQKVKEQVYKGFSIGGRKLPGGFDAATKTITAMQLTEISLVDRPANPESLITMFKVDDQTTQGDVMDEVKAEDKPVMDALLDVLSKSDAAQAEKMLEVAQAIAKGLTVTVRVDGMEGADQTSVDPDAKVGGNAASDQAPTAGTKDGEAVESVGEKISATEKDPKDPTNANNQRNAPNNPSFTVTGKSDADTSLRKAFKALACGSEVVTKGLYEVGNLAQLVDALGWLAMCAKEESEYEGDGSAVPAQLAAGLQTLGEALLAMAQEEIGELMATIKPEAAPLDAITEVIENCEQAKALGKFSEALDVIKAGKRNSTADQERVQKAHDMLAELGADCAKDDAEKFDHAAKAEGSIGKGQDIAKMASVVEKMASDISKMREELNRANALVDDLQKQVLKMPSAPKGSLMAIGKGFDAGSALGVDQEIEPVLKEDGSVDDLATAIKKVHSGGGRLNLGQR